MIKEIFTAYRTFDEALDWNLNDQTLREALTDAAESEAKQSGILLVENDVEIKVSLKRESLEFRMQVFGSPEDVRRERRAEIWPEVICKRLS